MPKEAMEKKRRKKNKMWSNHLKLSFAVSNNDESFTFLKKKFANCQRFQILITIIIVIIIIIIIAIQIAVTILKPDRRFL